MKTMFLLLLVSLAWPLSQAKADQYALNPEAYLYKNFADKLLLGGKVSEALFAYRWANLLDPSYGNAHYNRAIALNELGEFFLAREALNAYLKLCPKDSEALYNKGVLSLYLHDFERAEACLTKALCHCRENQFAARIGQALSFTARYRDCYHCCDKDGREKLRKTLLAFAR